MKNTLDKTKRLDTTEEKISQLEDVVVETTHNEVQRRKEIGKNKQSFRELQDNFQWLNVFEKKNSPLSRGRKKLEKTIAENFTKLMKTKKHRDQRQAMNPMHKKREENARKSHPNLTA